MNNKTPSINKVVTETINDTIDQRKNKKNWDYVNILIILTCIVIFIFSFIHIKNILFSSISNFSISFVNSSKETQDKAYEYYYNKAYQKAYDKAIRENKITNDVYISVNNIQEISKYEVLSVIEDETIIETDSQKKEGIYCWTRYKGMGIFMVDMKQSEILVDQENYFVSIKIPHPKMIYDPLVEETENFFYMDTRKEWFFFPKKDTKTGLNIKEQQESLANEKIYNKLINNNKYFEIANESAKNSLTNLVRSLNSEIADKLIIEIEFND